MTAKLQTLFDESALKEEQAAPRATLTPDAEVATISVTCTNCETGLLMRM